MQHKPQFARTQFLAREPHRDGGALERLAYLTTGAGAGSSGPTLVWVGGMMSDMRGSKAEAFHDWAARQGLGYVRFDFPGLGESSGDYLDGHVSRRVADTLAVIDELTEGPLLLIGSSMGGWVSLLAARARPDRVRALLLVNPAPDFTQWLMEDWSPEIRHRIERDGIVHIPSDYGDPTPYAWAWIEDGRANLVMEGDLGLDIPVHIFSGAADDVVPTARCRELADALADAELTVVEGGDHSLSRPRDIARMETALGKLIERVRG